MNGKKVSIGGSVPRPQLPPIHLVHLPIQSPQVVEQPQSHQPAGEQVDDPRDPLPQVEAVNTKDAQLSSRMSLAV